MDIKEKDLRTDLEIEKKAIMDMSIAKSSTANAVSYLTSALSLRCFAKNHKENEKDIEALSTALDNLIAARDLISDTLEPYLVFHEIDERNITDWIAGTLDEEDDDVFTIRRGC